MFCRDESGTGTGLPDEALFCLYSSFIVRSYSIFILCLFLSSAMCLFSVNSAQGVKRPLGGRHKESCEALRYNMCAGAFKERAVNCSAFGGEVFRTLTREELRGAAARARPNLDYIISIPAYESCRERGSVGLSSRNYQVMTRDQIAV